MTTRLATFHVASLLIGVPVAAVQEVLSGGATTPVPLAPGGVAGVLNLRGQLVTAVDARHRLGLPERGPTDGHGVSFILRTGAGSEIVSLVVDREGDVIEVEEDVRENVPDIVPDRIRDLVTDAYKLDNALLLVLDAHLAVDVAPE